MTEVVATDTRSEADHCIGCDHCLTHCPQRIHIPEEMQKIDNLVEQLKQR